jgi:hypothetical protein
VPPVSVGCRVAADAGGAGTGVAVKKSGGGFVVTFGAPLGGIYRTAGIAVDEFGGGLLVTFGALLGEIDLTAGIAVEASGGGVRLTLGAPLGEIDLDGANDGSGLLWVDNFLC